MSVEAATVIAATMTAAAATAMTETQRERKRSAPLFLSCFCGVKKKKKKKKKKQQKTLWILFWRVQKKKKKKKTIPSESPSSSSSSSSSSSEVILQKCLCKKTTMRQKNTTAPQLREDVVVAAATDSPPQQLLPSTSDKPSSPQTEPIQTSRSPDLTQTRISANQLPGRPRRSVLHPAPNHARTGRLRPLTGLWVMATTLGVMVFFGRACAVVFLCSCIYVMPVVKAAAGDGGGTGDRMDHKGVDLDSDEYKKKVIMEGLLERNGRRPSYAL